jgi:hypothetical protein
MVEQEGKTIYENARNSKSVLEKGSKSHRGAASASANTHE